MRGTDIAAKGGRRLMGLLEKYKFVLLVLLAGILLLLLPTFEGEMEQEAREELILRRSWPSTWRVWKKLSDTLSEVEGAGEVSVVLTVKASTRQVLAQDITSSQKEGAVDEGRTTVVVSKGSGREEAVPLQQIYPQFQGALVVCPGEATRRYGSSWWRRFLP